MLVRFYLVLFSLIFVSTSIFAQEEEDKEKQEVSEGRHSIAIVIAHARIWQGADAAGDKQNTLVPATSLDYNFWVTPKFAIGVHTDFLNEDFYIDTESDGKVIERERPIAPVLMGTYKLGEHWDFGMGFGGEFVKGPDYFVTRLGIEYGVEIRNGWEVLGSLTQDFRANAYNLTSFGLGIEKRFGKQVLP
jgi:hypothetical protein